MRGSSCHRDRVDNGDGGNEFKVVDVVGLENDKGDIDSGCWG